MKENKTTWGVNSELKRIVGIAAAAEGINMQDWLADACKLKLSKTPGLAEKIEAILKPEKDAPGEEAGPSVVRPQKSGTR